MPLTTHQAAILALLASSTSAHGYLAGGAAIHFAPNSTRYSNDLDFFHDTEVLVARAFAESCATMEAAGYTVDVALSQPGFIRATVSRGTAQTLVDWARDSAWRFMPLVHTDEGGWLLHPVDLAINKVLALAGRDEPRDLIDTLYVHHEVLPLGAIIWAATGKDPGLSPHALLELLKRRGHLRPEDVARLDLVTPFDLTAARQQWRDALDSAAAFVASRPPGELGCLYWSEERQAFVAPRDDEPVTLHFGRPGGVQPQVRDG